MSLTKLAQLTKLRNKGGNDADLLLHERITEVDSRVDEIEQKIAERPTTDEHLIERTALRLVTKVAQMEKGDVGEKGDPGDVGPQGPVGPAGESIVGPVGPMGPKGEPGESIVGPKGESGRDGADGINGKDGSPDMADDIRNKLELLSGDDRLDKSAVKGLDEWLEKTVGEIKSIRTPGPGRPMLYVDGTKRGQFQAINLIPGANVSFTYSFASGRNDITISAVGGTGTFGIIPVTGTINNSNVAFTTPSEPIIVVVNGQALRHGKGVTISGTNFTLDNPVGTGGDIYAL